MNEIERVARASLIDELALTIDQFLTHQIERDTLACDLTPSELTELATGVAAIAAMRGEPDSATDAENQRLRAEVEVLREDNDHLFDALFDAIAMMGHTLSMSTVALIGGEKMVAGDVWRKGHDLLLGKRDTRKAPQ